MYLLLVIAALIIYFLWSIRAKVLPGVYKSPDQWPWIGSLPVIMKTFDHHYHYKLGVIRDAVNKGHEMVTWSMVASPAYMEVCTPRMVEYMLKTNFDNFEKGADFHEIFFELLGDGIFNTDGDKWRIQRKVASHMFAARKLNEFMSDVFVNHIQDVLEILSRVKEFEVIDFQDICYRFTLDCICEIAFGHSLNCLKSTSQPAFAKSFDAAQEIATFRWFAPPIVWKTKRALGLGNEAKMKKHIDVINAFVYDVVRKRRENLDEEAADILSLFLIDAKKRGETLSDDYLRDIILNFMIAGRDTTASGLTYLFYLLSQHPHIEQSVCDELHDVMNGRLPTQETLKQLPLLEASFLEAIRLFPPVAGDNKRSIKDTVFPDGSRIPAGSVIAYSPFCLNRLEINYKQPDEFLPDRWLQTDDSGNVKVVQPSAFQYPTFNAGFRLCLGKPMAILEAKTFASAILQKYQLRLVPGHNIDYRMSVVIAMKHGLKMTVRPRNNEF